jgi:hypothetical protein
MPASIELSIKLVVCLSGELLAPPTVKLPAASMAPVRQVSDAGICGREWWRRRISNKNCDRSYLAAPRRRGGRNDHTVLMRCWLFRHGRGRRRRRGCQRNQSRRRLFRRARFPEVHGNIVLSEQNIPFKTKMTYQNQRNFLAYLHLWLPQLLFSFACLRRATVLYGLATFGRGRSSS